MAAEETQSARSAPTRRCMSQGEAAVASWRSGQRRPPQMRAQTGLWLVFERSLSPASRAHCHGSPQAENDARDVLARTRGPALPPVPLQASGGAVRAPELLGLAWSLQGSSSTSPPLSPLAAARRPPLAHCPLLLQGRHCRRQVPSRSTATPAPRLLRPAAAPRALRSPGSSSSGCSDLAAAAAAASAAGRRPAADHPLCGRGSQQRGAVGDRAGRPRRAPLPSQPGGGEPAAGPVVACLAGRPASAAIRRRDCGRLGLPGEGRTSGGL